MDFWWMLGSKKTPESLQKPSKKRYQKRERKCVQKSSKNEPVLTWNGKRGVVLDIACMWICSACTSGSVSALGSKRGSEESPNRLQEIANKPQQALGLAGICRNPY